MSRIGRPGSYLYEVLSSMVQNNVDYFKYIDTEVGNKILAQLNTMQELLQWIETSAYKTLSSVQSFDFDAETPANGYRSFLTVVDRYIILATKLCRTLCIKRDSVFFRSESCLKELTDNVSILRGLKTGMGVLVKMMEYSESGDLFVNHINLHDLFEECDGLDPTGFYGRSVGFYYCDSIRRIIRKGHAVMAAFRDQYYQSGGTLTHTTTSLISFGKYIMDPNLRAKQMVEMRRNVHVDFLKAMWSLNDLYIFKKVNKLVYTSLPICNDVIIPPEPQSLPKASDPSHKVDIPYPGTPGTVPPPLHCRLLSFVMRDGQQSVLPDQVSHSTRVMPASSELVLHCHGGGFIAQSAESHEIYLRDWAKQLNVPILSIDYSLSPENPFPRALEEVLYAYSWALNNCHKLGWTGERICVAGDSAGGILSLSLCLRTIQLDVRRPDAVFCAYTPMLLNACPSPSKVMSCVDPLVPLEFLLTCVHAYLGLEEVTADAGKAAGTSAQNEKPTDTSTTNGKVACTASTPLLQAEPNVKQAVKTPLLSDPSTTGFESDISTESVTDIGRESTKVEKEKEASTQPEHRSGYQNAVRYHAVDGEAGEEVIFEAQPSPSLSARQKAVLQTKHCVNNVSSTCTTDKANAKKPAVKEKIRKDSLPWFHPQNPDRMKTVNAIEKKASNPLISPYLAPDEMLRQMPPAYFMCLHLDPTLDDTIMFAKKLRSLGCSVSLKVLDFLPHGFLNLFPRGKEAQEGLQCCVDMIRTALELQTHVCE